VEQANRDAEIHEMRNRYEVYVDSLALPNEAIKQQMMTVFDQLKTIEDKKKVHDDYSAIAGNM